MTLDGKKKWTAALIAITGTVVAQFAPEQESAVMDVIQTMAPMLIGGIYIIAQWWHDDKKEGVKVEHEKTKQVEAKSMRSQEEVMQAIQPVLDDIYFEPFDPQAFASKLDTRAARQYLEINPITTYFAAQDKGKITPCHHLDQALSYWDFLATKSREAFEHMFGFPFQDAEQHLADDNPDCPYYSVDNMARQKGIHNWTMLRNVRWTSQKLADLEALADTDIDWQAKLGQQNHTLYAVGSLAKELLKNA